MTRPTRRKANWNSTPRRTVTAPAGPVPAPPEFLGIWRWRQPDPNETTEAWFERTERQRAILLDHAKTWLLTGRRVTVNLDPRTGGGDVAGRTGTILRLNDPAVPDFVSVHFTAAGREKRPRVRLLPLEVLTPTE